MRNFGLGLRVLSGRKGRVRKWGSVVENGTDESSVKRKENFCVASVLDEIVIFLDPFST